MGFVSAYSTYKKTTSGALELALSAVDKVAGRRARDELENQVDQIAQSELSSKALMMLLKLIFEITGKLFNKFTK